MFTPKRAIHPCSDNESEILVVCQDENGKTRNITVSDETLGAQLSATPATIPNPAFQPLVDAALLLASDALAAEAIAAEAPAVEGLVAQTPVPQE